MQKTVRGMVKQTFHGSRHNGRDSEQDELHDIFLTLSVLIWILRLIRKPLSALH
jgi:hypothetical protein